MKFKRLYVKIKNDLAVRIYKKKQYEVLGCDGGTTTH